MPSYRDIEALKTSFREVVDTDFDLKGIYSQTPTDDVVAQFAAGLRPPVSVKALPALVLAARYILLTEFLCGFGPIPTSLALRTGSESVTDADAALVSVGLVARTVSSPDAWADDAARGARLMMGVAAGDFTPLAPQPVVLAPQTEISENRVEVSVDVVNVDPSTRRFGEWYAATNVDEYAATVDHVRYTATATRVTATGEDQAKTVATRMIQWQLSEQLDVGS